MKMWLNIAWKNVILSPLFTKDFILKKNQFCECQIHGRQKQAISWVLKNDFRTHKKSYRLWTSTLTPYGFIPKNIYSSIIPPSSKQLPLNCTMLGRASS